MNTLDLIRLKSSSYHTVITEYNYFISFLNLKLWLFKLEFRSLYVFNDEKYNL